MKEKKIKVAVGMSGGVDSSVAAKMLVDQGYDVIGFMIKFWADESCLTSRDNACCDPQSVEDAKRIARQIGIPFYVVDCREQFKKTVANYFIEEYKNHRTPNPCVVCNEKIKFGWFLDFARSLGCDYVATGHYARIEDSRSSNNQVTNSKKAFKLQAPNSKLTYKLLKGVDKKKDQSYFLHRLNQEQLSHILLPLGGMTKDEARALAKKRKLPVGEKKESQEVCFIGDKDYRDFLKRQLPSREFKPGNIVNTDGYVVGHHRGLMNYTIGQRRGVNQTGLVSSSTYQVSWEKQGENSTNNKRSIKNHSDKQPLYVLGVNSAKNELIVGEENDLYRNEMLVKSMKWTRPINIKELEDKELYVKIRYRAEAVPCSITNNQDASNKKITIKFKQPQRAITPGQSAVFYIGEEVLGGGVIS